MAGHNILVPEIDWSEIAVNAVKTPIGWIAYALSANGLDETRMAFPTRSSAMAAIQNNFSKTRDGVRFVKRGLKACFDGWDAIFIDSFRMDPMPRDSVSLPINRSRWSFFSVAVFDYVMTIPWGRTQTYCQVARSIGRPKASRAVGMAMARNPVAPLVPCHRVVGRDNIGGYSANGGLDLKERLLRLEKGYVVRRFSG